MPKTQRTDMIREYLKKNPDVYNRTLARPFAFTKWNHGFAHVEVDDDGMFEVDNYRIIGGKAR